MVLRENFGTPHHYSQLAPRMEGGNIVTYRHPERCDHEPFINLYPDGRQQCPWCGAVLRKPCLSLARYREGHRTEKAPRVCHPDDVMRDGDF